MIHPSKHDDVHYEDADGSMMSTSIIEIGLSTFYDAKLGWQLSMASWYEHDKWRMKNEKWQIMHKI